MCGARGVRTGPIIGCLAAAVLCGGVRTSSAMVSLAALIAEDEPLISFDGEVMFTDFAYSDPAGLTPATEVFLEADPSVPGGFHALGSWQSTDGAWRDVMIEYTATSLSGAPFLSITSILGDAEVLGIESGPPELRSQVSIAEMVESSKQQLRKLSVFLQAGYEIHQGRVQWSNETLFDGEDGYTELRITKTLGLIATGGSDVPDMDTTGDGAPDVNAGLAAIDEFYQDFVVPEPGTLGLLVAGLLITSVGRRRL
jgi:hypothetical protein